MSSLLDYILVAVTPILIKCFGELVLQHIQDNIPASHDPHSYALRTNRCTKDAISTAVRSVSQIQETSQTGMVHVWPRISVVPIFRVSVALVKWVVCKEPKLLKDNNYTHSLFSQLPSGKRYRSIRCCTTSLSSSFFSCCVVNWLIKESLTFFTFNL